MRKEIVEVTAHATDACASQRLLAAARQPA